MSRVRIIFLYSTSILTRAYARDVFVLFCILNNKILKVLCNEIL